MTTVTKRRPLWHRLRDALADIEHGLYPSRALTFHDIPKHWYQDARLGRLIERAEAACQRAAVGTIQSAGTRQTEHVTPANRDSSGNGSNGSSRITSANDGGRVRVSARVWETKDWRAPAWLLERRFPQEWGQQSTVNLEVTPAASLLAKLADMASKRGELASKRQPALGAGEAPEATRGTSS